MNCRPDIPVAPPLTGPPLTEDLSVGNDPVATARAAAQDARAAAVVAKDAAAAALADDTNAYAELIAGWDALKGLMTPEHFNACLAALNAAAAAQQTESLNVAAAIGYIVGGDAQFADAEAMPNNPPMPKVGAYNSARDSFNAAAACCQTAAGAHATFATQASAAGAILIQYG